MNYEALKLLAQLSTGGQCLSVYGIKVFNPIGNSTTYMEDCTTVRKICDDIEKAIAELKSAIPG